MTKLTEVELKANLAGLLQDTISDVVAMTLDLPQRESGNRAGAFKRLARYEQLSMSLARALKDFCE